MTRHLVVDQKQQLLLRESKQVEENELHLCELSPEQWVGFEKILAGCCADDLNCLADVLLILRLQTAAKGIEAYALTTDQDDENDSTGQRIALMGLTPDVFGFLPD